MDGVEERRRHKRVPVDISGELAFGDAGYPVRVVDLSLGGALLEGDSKFTWPEMGDLVVVRMSMAGRKINLFAMLVRREGNKAGVTFESVDLGNETQLARFVHEQDRRILKAHLHLLG